MQDRIHLTIYGGQDVIDAVSLHIEFFKQEILALKVDLVLKELEECELEIAKQVLV